MCEVDDLKGFSRNKPLKKVGMKGQDTCELFFDDCRIPVENILGGEEGQGFYQLMAQLPRERLIIGVGAIAAVEAVLEQTIEYTKERKAFKKPLIDFQNTKFKLAEIATEAKISRVFIDYCIGELQEDRLDNETASMAKWWCSEKQFEAAHQCLQLHGGYGYMMEYSVAHYFADSRVQMIYGGSNEIMKELISRSL
jgi:acyl-CoA dehydrogenase